VLLLQVEVHGEPILFYIKVHHSNMINSDK